MPKGWVPSAQTKEYCLDISGYGQHSIGVGIDG
jgi:hypothetical protein